MVCPVLAVSSGEVVTNFQCAKCGRRFSDSCDMVDHLAYDHYRIPEHPGEYVGRVTKCPVCHRTYSQIVNMQKHLLYHARKLEALMQKFKENMDITQ